MNLKSAGVVMIISVVLLGGLVTVWYYSPITRPIIQQTETATTTEKIMSALNANQPNQEAVIARWYAPLTPLMLGSTTVQASIADTDAEREQGLSDTPYLPEGIVKLFIFDENERWSFWMKDMNYAIDMIWLDDTKTVVYVAENVTPESYPSAFTPSQPARYVIETVPGFASKHGIAVGTSAAWGELLPN